MHLPLFHRNNKFLNTSNIHSKNHYLDIIVPLHTTCNNTLYSTSVVDSDNNTNHKTSLIEY